jgi:hypothetical protein
MACRGDACVARVAEADGRVKRSARTKPHGGVWQVTKEVFVAKNVWTPADRQIELDAHLRRVVTGRLSRRRFAHRALALGI